MSDDDDLEAAVARLTALEAAAVERQARDRERAKKPSVRTPPSLAEADRRQKARERSGKVLQDAELVAPDDFDPVGMWEAIEGVFRFADLRAKTATVPSQADIQAAVDVRKAAQALADATAELFERDRSVGLAVALRLRHLSKTAMPKSAAAAIDFLFRCPEGAIALVEAAKEATADMDAALQAGPAWPRAAGEPAAAWLFAEGLPGVFIRFLGKKATFFEGRGTTRRSECVRFIQAAHVAMGREQPADTNIVQTVKRARRASAIGTQPPK